MPSMKSVINKHNTSLLKPKSIEPVRSCNCPNKEACPLSGECLKRKLVYNAKVESASGTSNYIGVTEGPFKGRLGDHELSFRNRGYETKTRLSRYIWELNDRNELYAITWSIREIASSYVCGTRKCDLCTAEKLSIATADIGTTLNLRSELVAKCRHRGKFSLGRLKDT